MNSIRKFSWHSWQFLSKCHCRTLSSLQPKCPRLCLGLPRLPSKQHLGPSIFRYYCQSPPQDAGIRKLRNYKRIFAISLFTSTLVFAWYLKRQKGLRLKAILEEFTRLPLDESLFGSEVSLYSYKGYIFPGQLVMSGVFKELPNFQFKESDVIVASYPKAGTTWIQEIVYMLTHNFQRTDGNSEVLETRFPYLEYPYPGIKSLASQQGPRYIKTHLPLVLLPPSFQESNAKLIYICRNPRDIAVSYYYFMRLLTQSSFHGSFGSFIKMFTADLAMYSPFFEHVLGYWRERNNPNILFVSYEELHQEPIKVVKQIAEFLNIETSSDDINFVTACTSFGSMSTNPSVNYEHWKDFGFAHKDQGQFLRKGEVGNWKSHLNAEEVAAFAEWENKHLQNTGLKFTFEKS